MLTLYQTFLRICDVQSRLAFAFAGNYELGLSHSNEKHLLPREAVPYIGSRRVVEIGVISTQG